MELDITASQNNWGWKGLQRSLVQSPAQSRVSSEIRLAFYSWVLKTSGDTDCRAFLGKLFHFLTYIENCRVKFNGFFSFHLPEFQLCCNTSSKFGKHLAVAASYSGGQAVGLHESYRVWQQVFHLLSLWCLSDLKTRSTCASSEYWKIPIDPTTVEKVTYI